MQLTHERLNGFLHVTYGKVGSAKGVTHSAKTEENCSLYICEIPKPPKRHHVTTKSITGCTGTSKVGRALPEMTVTRGASSQASLSQDPVSYNEWEVQVLSSHTDGICASEIKTATFLPSLGGKPEQPMPSLLQPPEAVHPLALTARKNISQNAPEPQDQSCPSIPAVLLPQIR